MKLDIKPVRVKNHATAQESSQLQFSFNYHKDVSTNGATNLAALLSHWAEFETFGQTIMAKFP